MMKNRQGSAFWMEVSISALLFVLCASVCVLIFAKANQLSRQAWELNRGVQAAQVAVEQMKAGAAELEEFFYYDAQWQPAEQQTPQGYVVRRVTSRQQDMLVGQVTVCQGEREIYTLTGQVYRPE